LRVFGVLPQAGGDGGDGAAESKEAEILDTLARFRQQVPCPHCLLAVPRHPRPSPLSPDQRARGPQVRKTAISSANVKKDVLSLCDQLRDKDLPAVGFRLEVNPRFVSWSSLSLLLAPGPHHVSAHHTPQTGRPEGRELVEESARRRSPIKGSRCGHTADLSDVARSPPHALHAGPS